MGNKVDMILHDLKRISQAIEALKNEHTLNLLVGEMDRLYHDIKELLDEAEKR